MSIMSIDMGLNLKRSVKKIRGDLPVFSAVELRDALKRERQGRNRPTLVKALLAELGSRPAAEHPAAVEPAPPTTIAESVASGIPLARGGSTFFPLSPADAPAPAIEDSPPAPASNKPRFGVVSVR